MQNRPSTYKTITAPIFWNEKKKKYVCREYVYDSKIVLGEGAFASGFSGSRKVGGVYKILEKEKSTDCIPFAGSTLKKLRSYGLDEGYVLKISPITQANDKETVQSEAKLTAQAKQKIKGQFVNRKVIGPIFVREYSTNFGCLIIPFAKGKTFKKILEEDQPKARLLTLEERIKLALNLMDALSSQVHECGLIHRDLKEENIIIDLETLEVTIIDFGLSMAKDFKTIQSVGTPLFFSPEHILKLQQDEKSDSYTLGKIIGLLFGFAATSFRADTMSEVIDYLKNDTQFDIQFSEPNKPKVDLGDYSKDFEKLLKNMTKSDRSQRFSLQEAKLELLVILKNMINNKSVKEESFSAFLDEKMKELTQRKQAREQSEQLINNPSSLFSIKKPTSNLYAYYDSCTFTCD